MLGVGLLLRLVYLGHLVDTPYFKTPVLDELYHDQWAVRLAGGEWVGREPFFRAPLYPYLLGGLYAVFGPNAYLARLFGLLLGVGTIYLVYRIGTLAFSDTVGLIAAAMAAGYRTLIYFEGELLITGLLVFLVHLALFWILKASRMLSGEGLPGTADSAPGQKLPGSLFVVGLCLGLAAIARPNVLVFVPFVLVWFGWLLRRRGGSFWRGQAPQLGLVAGIFLVVFPVTLYNGLAGGDWVLVSSQAGINFHIGNNPDADGYTSETPEYYDFYGGYEDSVALFARKKAEEVLGRPLKPSEVSRYWFRQGLKFWIRQPLAAFQLTLKKLYLFWSNIEIRNNKNLYFMRRYSWVQRVPYLNFALIASLGLAGSGAYFYERRRLHTAGGQQDKGRHGLSPLPLVLIGFVFFYMLSVIVFFVCARYRQPIIPSLMIFAAYGLTWVWRRRKKRMPLAVYGLAVLVLLWVLTRNPYGLTMKDFAEDHWSVANCYQEQGELARAEQHYRQALKLRPDFVEAHLNLGNCYFRRGDKASAAGSYERVLRLAPRHPKALNNLGRCLLDEDRAEEAEPLLRRALEEEPDHPYAHNNLGEALSRLGREDEALGEFQRSVEILPGNATAWRNLGALYRKRGEMEKAQECFLRADSLAPKDAGL